MPGGAGVDIGARVEAPLLPAAAPGLRKRVRDHIIRVVIAVVLALVADKVALVVVLRIVHWHGVGASNRGNGC